MSDETLDVLIAVYLIPDLAKQDFDAFVEARRGEDDHRRRGRPRHQGRRRRGHVEETGDHLGQKGAVAGGGVGLVVGLFAPPLLAATAVGAGVGGIAGKFARKRLEAGIGEKMDDALPPGSAGIIAIYEHEDADAVAGGARELDPQVDRPDRQGVREGAQGRARGSVGGARRAEPVSGDDRPRLRRRHWHLHRDRRRHGASSRRERVPRLRRRSARGGRRGAARAGPDASDAGDRRRHGRGGDLGGGGDGRRTAVGERGLAGLVNNAGIGVPAPIEFQPMADFRKQLEVNLFGPVAMIQAFMPLIRRGGGRIVNVGSIGGMIVLPLNGAYSASKFGMQGDQRRATARAAAVEHPRVPDRGRAREDGDLRQVVRGAGRAREDARRGGLRALRAADRRDPEGRREGGGRRGPAARHREGDPRCADVGQAEDEVSGRPRREGRPPSRRRFPTERGISRSPASSDFRSRSSASAESSRKEEREHRDETEGPGRVLQPHAQSARVADAMAEALKHGGATRRRRSSSSPTSGGCRSSRSSR